MRSSEAWEAPAWWTEPISEEDDAPSVTPLVLTSSAPTKTTEATSIQSSPDLISSHVSRAQDQLQQARDLDKAGRSESAKSLCRKVIHDSEGASGINDSSYREAILLLAEIYEGNGDTSEATQLRQLADPQQRIEKRNRFKNLLEEQDSSACIEEALSWVVLLHHSAILHQYREFAKGLLALLPEEEFSESVILIVLAATGNSLLVQLMVSRGPALHTEVAIENWSTETITALNCSMRFQHNHLVQIILQHSPESVNTDLFLKYLQNVFLRHEFQTVRLICDNLPDHSLLSIARRLPNKCMRELLVGRHFEIASLFLEKGASPAVRFDAHHSMLRKAVDSSDYELAELLLKHGALSKSEEILRDLRPYRYKAGLFGVSFKNATRLTLQAAVAKGDFQMTRLLLRHGATRNLEPISDKIETPNVDPVILAIQNGSLDMMKLLTKEKTHVSPIAVKAAVQAGWMVGIAYLLSINPACATTAEVKAAWSDAVVSATKEQSLELMRSWVKEKSHVSLKAVQATVDAQWVEDLGILLALHRTMSKAAVFFAARSSCDTTVLEALLKMGGDRNSQGQNPCFSLEAAALARNVDHVNILLNAGADVNKYHLYDVEKRTALVQVVMVAVKFADSNQLPGYLKMITLLVGAGARTDQAGESEGYRDKEAQ